MKKRLLTIGLSLLCIAVVVCTVILLQINRIDELEALQQELLAELESKAGEYDDRQIVLYGTSNSEAKELAELFGAELRITSNGRFARLTLPEGTTIYDIYSNDEYRVYLEDMSIDYKASVSELTEVGEEEEKAERLPMVPEYSVTDTDFSMQSYYNYINMKNVWSSYTGSGVTVAVIDTGIDTDHPEFVGRISEYSYNATEDKIVKDYNYDWSLVEDEQGHGTAVTGVIAASMNSGNIVGIAPKVNIIVIKAECDKKGNFARTSDLVFGLYYAIERDVQVVNMSFGGNDFDEKAVQLAYDSDVICVASAGNESTSSLTYPAAYEHVIGVGALADGSWELADYSNYGENTDVVAPGTTYTAEIGGGYKAANGTSLSAPIVTGAVALFMQNNKYVTFDEVTEVLYESTYDLGDLGPDWYYGYGALDVYELLKGERGTITFDMLTDELENTEQLFIRGHALQNIPEPERTYAVFDGWYYDYTCTEELDYYRDEFKGDVTLYAKWVNEEDGVPYTYVTLDDGTIEIRSYTGKRRYITIPEKIDGKIVSSIGDFAFSGQTRLREITLPSGLTNIGDFAFENCSNLVTIEIPANVTTIGEYAFRGNVRLNVVAFLGNSKLKSIGDFAFESCGRLERIELPATLESINGSAFYGTAWLSTIDVQSGNKNFVDVDGVLFNVAKTTIVAYPSAHGTSYELPDSVTTIGQYAFALSDIATLDLDGVVSIEKAALTVSALESVVIPDSVTSMGETVFANCSYLAEVTIGRGIEDVPEYTFSACNSLDNIFIPNTIKTIDKNAFSLSAINTVDFENESTLTVIGANAFTKTPLRSIEIPASVLTIDSQAFMGNKSLNNVTFESGSNLSFIGSSVFEECYSLTTITLPSKLQTIGGMAFMSSGLTGTVTVPSSVTEIGRGAFASCSALTAIDVEEGNTVYHDIDGVVYTLDNRELHAYPAGKVDTKYTVNNATVSLMPYSFTECVNLTTANLPIGLEQIAEKAFYHCKSLSNITIPNNVTQIGRYSFAECWKLSKITINNSSKLTRLSYGAFAYSGITSFTVPTNVSTMARGVFEGCCNLTSITFAENSKLESISAYMFDGCSNLTSITFKPGSNLTSVQAHGLEGMDKLITLDFENTKLTNVDNFAFRFCESLSSVNLPETVTNIGRYAFYGCKSMKELSVPAAVEHIGMFAFLGTGDMNLYFNADSLLAYADENWDYDLKGYYLGVTEVITDGDFKYAKTTGGNIAILEYLGTSTTVDLTAYNFGAPITIIGGSAFKESIVESITFPDTLVTIQAEAFANSKLKNISITAGVTFIGREAFVNTPIESLTFAENSNITTIEQYAFELTRNLTNVTLPQSLTTMGTGVFSQSGITNVTFEEGIAITEIPQNAFVETKLTSVSIPNSVSLVNHNAFNNVQTLKNVTFGTASELRLMSNAFYHTGLTSLHIPENVTFIGEYCFVALPDLTSITVDEANPNYKSVDGLLLTKSGRKLITVPAGRIGTLNVPVSIEEIGFGAFEETKLSKVKFDKNANILTFGYRAFFKAENITEITIPASVVSIDYYAFAYCTNLKTVNFADGTLLKGIYEGAFCGDINLENITIPDSIVEISDFSFYGCSKIDEIPVSETTNLKGIYDYAFAYTNIDGEYTFPGYLIDIGDYAFAGCDFTKITVPDDNKKQLFIGLGAFEDCNKLEDITLPFIGASYEDEEIAWFGYIFGAGSYEANDTYVPDSLKKVTITEGITFVGSFAFYEITTISEASIPHSVQKIHTEAFNGTNFSYKLTNDIITVDSGMVGYISYGKKYFGTGITELNIDDSITELKAYALSGLKNLKSIKLPSNITVINNNLFEYCTSIDNIKIPDGVIHIAERAFWNCDSLTNIQIPVSVTTIGNYAFDNCDSLETINIPNSVKNIGIGAFRDCTGLVNARIPNSITTIKESTFEGCLSLISITIPNSVTFIEVDAFNYCEKLETFTIPSSVTSIGSSVFEGCNTLGILYNNSNIRLSFDNPYPCGAPNLQLIVDKNGINYYPDSSEVVYMYGDFTYKIIDGNYVLLLYMGNSDIVTLPADIEGNPYSISTNFNAKHIILPESMDSQNIPSFQYMKNIVSIEIETHIPEIYDYQFCYCSSLESVILPDGVTSIGRDAFAGCRKLNSINIPQSVTEIGDSAFFECKSFENVVIPDNVSELGAFAFNECSSLKNIRLSRKINKLKDNTFKGCALLESLVLPNNLINIGENAFAGCDSLKALYIPAKVKVINALNLPNAVVTIDPQNTSFTVEDGILYNKEKTKAFSIVGKIGDNIVFPQSVKSISASLFMGYENIVSVELPDGILKIEDSMFENCTNLKEIIIPESVTSIGAKAFKDCSSLKTITIPSSVSEIQWSAFENCISLESINLSNTKLTAISHRTFANCTGLSDVELPNSVTSIGENTFYNCHNISTTTIPANIKEIRGNAFENCYKLRKIRNYSNLNIIPGDISNGRIAEYAYVVIDKSDNYIMKEDTNRTYGYFDGYVYSYDGRIYKLLAYLGEEDTIVLPTSINGNTYTLDCFYGAEHIIIPEGTTVINDEAFKYNTQLKYVTLPDSVHTIRPSAFELCINLEKINIPDGMKYVSGRAFTGCEKLLENTEYYKNGMLIIDGWLLYVDPDLRYLSNIESINNIARLVYEECYYLKNAISNSGGLPSNMTTLYINDLTADFHNIVTLKNIIISDSVDPLDLVVYGRSLFERCGIENVTIYVEMLEKDLRWDDNFPGWNNGNKVIYGDKWSMLNFYDNNGVLIYSEPRLNSQIIRLPSNISDDPCLDFIGWDTNGDGEVDGIPASSISDISATAIAEVRHDIIYHNAKSSTCTEIGWDAYEFCSRCNYTTYGETIPLGHDFSPEWTIDVEPTTTTLGQKSRHCSRCDEITDVIEIAKLVEIIDTSKKFTDVVASSWAKPGIDYVVSCGYMNGTGNGTTFSPTGTMSRSMIVTVLYRIAGQPSHSGNNPFKDIETGWYYDAVLWAYENGIVNGTSATTFAPNGDVTREQMATFLYRFASYRGFDDSAYGDLTVFPDESKIGSWAYFALSWANAEGLITGAKGSDGVTRLDPQGNATREQVATILMRFCQTFEE